MMSPLVSVVLPVYNGEKYMKDAIDSILAQTWHDFEFIIIDDGSRDATWDIIKSYTDPRLVAVKQENSGLAATLNRAIGMARGKYIARQDHDDVSRADRLKQQVEFMESHSDCVLLGTRSEIWVDDRNSGRTHSHPLNSGEIKIGLLFDNPFVHSSVMFRKDVVERVGGYTEDSARQPPEDYELWSRMARDSSWPS